MTNDLQRKKRKTEKKLCSVLCTNRMFSGVTTFTCSVNYTGWQPGEIFPIVINNKCIINIAHNLRWIVWCWILVKSHWMFYFYVKQFCVLITVNQWCCHQWWDGHVPINLSCFDIRISLVNIVTQKMCSFETVNRTKLSYNVNYS